MSRQGDPAEMQEHWALFVASAQERWRMVQTVFPEQALVTRILEDAALCTEWLRRSVPGGLPHKEGPVRVRLVHVRAGMRPFRGSAGFFQQDGVQVLQELKLEGPFGPPLPIRGRVMPLADSSVIE